VSRTRAASAAEPSRGFTRGFPRAPVALATLLAALACGHGEPFGATPPGALEPLDPTLPRRLTFNSAADVSPSVVGDTIVFSRQDSGRADGDVCLALLPVEGGRLYRTACAHGTSADTVRDSWLRPAVSPDRRRVAFLYERRAVASGGLLSRALVVASFDAPDSVAVTVAGSYDLPGGGLGNGFHQISWADDVTVRFLGGTETSGANASFVPAGVFQFPVGTDPSPDPQIVPDLADATLYAVNDDGTVYFVSGTDGAVYRWTAGSAPVLDGPFDCLDGSGFGGLTGLAVSGGVLSVIATCLYPQTPPRSRLLARDLSGGAPRSIEVPFLPAGVAGVPGRPWVVLEVAGDLWLAALR
jgi:hypothetical protein